MQKKRLYVDMDGTLAVFRNVQTIETLYEEGYFLNLEPIESVVQAIKKIVLDFPEIEVFILSSVLTDSQFALDEKNRWLDRYLPEVSIEHRIFPPCGQDKKDYIAGGVSENDYLLDDYTENLIRWEPPAKGIKLLNGINGTKGTWKSERISIEKNEAEIAYNVVNIMYGREHCYDVGPNYEGEYWALNDVYLTHDGFARFDMHIYDRALGYPSNFQISGKIQLGNIEKKVPAQIVNLDTYGIKHPIIKREWKAMETAIMQKLESAIVNDVENSNIISKRSKRIR